MKKRVLMFYPKAQDATSLWRGAGPMKLLAKTMTEIEFVELNEDVDWSVLWGFDIMFLQRPSNRAHKEAILLCKRMGIKVWLDYDDDLFSIPVSNPASLTYNDHDIQRDIMSMMAMADVITVSTKCLQKKYSEFNKNVFVAPNAWNEKFFSYREPSKIARAKAVLWRGTRTHAEDIDTFLHQIERLARDHPDWKFVFIGGVYWKIHHVIPEAQLSVIEPMEQTLFYETIYRLGAKIMMVPLADHVFNRAKSNIAWQEGAFCASTVVCPAWEEWQKPGAQNYDDPEDFEKIMRRLMTPGTDLSTIADMSWTYIRENLTLEKVNNMRSDITKLLLGLK